MAPHSASRSRPCVMMSLWFACRERRAYASERCRSSEVPRGFMEIIVLSLCIEVCSRPLSYGMCWLFSAVLSDFGGAASQRFFVPIVFNLLIAILAHHPFPYSSRFPSDHHRRR